MQPPSAALQVPPFSQMWPLLFCESEQVRQAFGLLDYHGPRQSVEHAAAVLLSI